MDRKTTNPTLEQDVFIYLPNMLITSVSACHRQCIQARQKKFMRWINSGKVEKMTKALRAGIDPNFMDADTGGEDLHASELI